MKYITQFLKVRFCFLFILLIVQYVSLSTSAQQFYRNDNFDNYGTHEIIAATDYQRNFYIYVESNSDFPLFKLHIKKDKLTLVGGGALHYAGKYKISIDGNVVLDWTSSDEKYLVYNFSSPLNGISEIHLISVEVDYYDESGNHQTLQSDCPVTILSKPRIFNDSENNSFVQLRNEDPVDKIPVLFVEGFDPLNDKFPELYYNLTWYLVNSDLYPNGYEVFILNFNDGGRDLRLNAQVLLNALNKIHEICPNYQIVVGGLSMGGPITRYALAQSEEQGIEHNVGLFLSYDSPYNVPQKPDKKIA